MDLGVVGAGTESCDKVEMAWEDELYRGGAAGDADAEDDVMVFEEVSDEEEEFMMGQDDEDNEATAEGVDVTSNVLEDLLGLMKVCLHFPCTMTSYISKS